MEEITPEIEYVPQKTFEVYLRQETEKNQTSEKMYEAKFNLIELKIDTKLKENTELLTKILTRMEILEKKIESNNVELRDGISELRAALIEKMSGLRTELAEKISEIKSELTEKINQVELTLTERMEAQEKLIDEKLEHVTDTLTVAIGGANSRLDDMNSTQNKWFMLFGVLIVIAPIIAGLLQSFWKK